MIDIETIKTIATEDWEINWPSKTVLELITRLEDLEVVNLSILTDLGNLEEKLVAQELVIQQLRDALDFIDSENASEEVLRRALQELAIPTSTEHLEAWYKEMVGEPTGYYFRDDPEKFAMPGSGYSHDYPTEALDVVPLHAIKPFPFKGE